MFSKIFSLSNATLVVALSLSTVAAWYSIIGLTAIFAGAAIPVIIMGSILEIGKITTTVWLRKYWDRAGWLIKLYLVPAVVALALLTSMGIFGFLSKAHMDQGITSGDVQAKLSLYDEKIKTQRDNIQLARKALDQMDQQVDARLSRGDSENSAERAVAIRRQQQGERTRLQKEIGDAQKEIAKLNEERAPVAAENRKVEAEVGPIKYVAALIYGDNPDSNLLERAVRWVIILLVAVFDPLAIALVLAANQSKEWDKERTDDENAMAIVPPEDLGIETRPFTEEEMDALNNVTEVEKPWHEKFPYLNKPFTHFRNTKPMVAKQETPVVPATPEDEAFKELEDNIARKINVLRAIHKEPEVEVTPIVDEPTIAEQMADTVDPEAMIIAEPSTEEEYKTIPFNDVPGPYVEVDGKHMTVSIAKTEYPDLELSDETESGSTVKFGNGFPKYAQRGDIWTRTDVVPNTVHKYNGIKWILLDKSITQSYLTNNQYIEHLVNKISTGEYDFDLLTMQEQEIIESYVQNAQNNNKG